MKFSILHPTARVKPMGSFPQGWLAACLQWHDACQWPALVEYIVVVHHSRLAEFWGWLQVCRCGGRDIPQWGRFSVVVNYGRDCAADQCNAGYLAASGEILIGSQDDLLAPEDWDAQIVRAIPDTSQAIALGCNPRERQDLFLPGICTRVLADKIGPISPEYESMFFDNEFADQARRLGTVIEIPLAFDHPHPLTNQRNQMDEVYALQNRKEAYNVGKAVYESRKAAGFPRVELPGWQPRPVVRQPQLGLELESPVKPGLISRALDWLENQIAAPAAPPVVEPEGRRIALCLPGESFHFHWQQGLVQLTQAIAIAGWQQRLIFGYTTSCYSTRINLAEEVMNSDLKPEYVWWMDDDNIIKPPDFLRLLDFLETHPEADMVVGWCWIAQSTPDKKGDRWGPSVANFWKEDGVHLTPLEIGELFADNAAIKLIEHTGFPGVLMRYSVLEKLGPGAFRPVIKSDLLELLKGIPTTLEVSDEWFAGEDGCFCLRARAAGLKIYVDPLAKLAHLKFISQEPDMQLFKDTPQELKDWREQVMGKAILAPENFEEVIK